MNEVQVRTNFEYILGHPMYTDEVYPCGHFCGLYPKNPNRNRTSGRISIDPLVN